MAIRKLRLKIPVRKRVADKKVAQTAHTSFLRRKTIPIADGSIRRYRRLSAHIPHSPAALSLHLLYR